MSVFAILARLAPEVEKEVNLMINSKQEAESLSSKLKKIVMGLEEAEKKRVTDESVKVWLKEVEDVTYEMDDVLDEFQTANLQVQLQGSDDVVTTSFDLWKKVRSLFLSLGLCFNQVVKRREIAKKMRALSDRIDGILKNRGEYTLVSSSNKDDGSQEFKQEQSTSLVNEFKIYGLDPLKNSLVEKLVKEGVGESSDSTEIISIVGIGGVGKTTLAQLVYNHPEIIGLFAPRAWVSVSQSSDTWSIAKAILEALGEISVDSHNLETLVQCIKKALDNKRFLLVLDNVWTEDRSKWESLKRCLNGAKGSRVLVTSRSESVARMMGTVQWQPLGLLSDSDCGAILNGIALEGRAMKECEKLREIGNEIAKKCNGLPLAARSVGSMLADRSTVMEWKSVLESPLWKNEDKESELFNLLNLSYIDLSPLLKRCFLSSIVFPKGALITIDEMIRIWTAYGYLSSNSNVDQGLQYFKHLTKRSFFQKFQSDEEDEEEEDAVSYKMHDIMHDFANYLTVNDQYSFIMDGRVEKEKRSSLSSSSNNLPWNSLGRLRTFCARNVSEEELPLNIIGHLTSVRVLSFYKCGLEVLPRDIGKLTHLRHLNLSCNPITELPDSVCNLCNLQTLDIEKCHNISSYPRGMEKLINLRYLVNSDTYRLKECSQGVAQLSGLRTLSEFRGSKLGYLRNLNHLQGSLSLHIEDFNGSIEEMVGEIGKADLRKKIYLQKLILRFWEEDEDMVGFVDALEPPPNLETLIVRSKSGQWLSHWIGSTAMCFDNLKVVNFHGDRKCSKLPPFGKLPALEKLKIQHCRHVCLGSEFLGKGSFPRLNKLCFEYCEDWEEWEDIDEEDIEEVGIIFSRLEELEIIESPKLQGLPHTILGRATSLQVLRLSSQSLYDRYNKLDGYDRHTIPHIPNVNYVSKRITESQFVEGLTKWLSIMKEAAQAGTDPLNYNIFDFLEL